MTNFDYKTLVPALVGPAVLLYESVSGHTVASNVQNVITVDAIAVVGFALSVWGTFKNHQKGSVKNDKPVG